MIAMLLSPERAEPPGMLGAAGCAFAATTAARKPCACAPQGVSPCSDRGGRCCQER